MSFWIKQSLLFFYFSGTRTSGFLPLKEMLAESFDRIDELHKRSGT